jgi:hypothetical protein
LLAKIFSGKRGEVSVPEKKFANRRLTLALALFCSYNIPVIGSAFLQSVAFYGTTARGGALLFPISEIISPQAYEAGMAHGTTS